ncbi:MAG: hypothetical protein K2M86_01760, partial [Odoribacter sp.]|nr:hypothetical protein [Odoribacter sp.]
YLRNIEDLRVQRSVMDTAIREGKAEGRAEGRIEGREEGRIEGREEGRIEGKAEGEHDAQQRIASNLKKLGFSVQDIATSTGLTPEEIALL